MKTAKEYWETRKIKLLSKNICLSCGKNLIALRSVSRCEECLTKTVLQQKNKYHTDETFRKKANKYGKEKSATLRLEVIYKYGNCCACCGETEDRFWEIDHIDGGGNKHRRELGLRKLFEWLKKNNYPKGFQILCSNCNKAKAICGVCPHQKKRNEISSNIITNINGNSLTGSTNTSL